MSDLRGGVRALFGSSSAAVHRLTDADERLRSAMPVSRRISFLAAAGGCGTTSALASVASLLAARRPGMVLAADAGGGRAGLLARSGVAETSRGQTDGADEQGEERQAELRRRTAQRAEDARHGLPRGATGLYLLELAAPGRRRSSSAEWAERVGPISRFYDLVLTDWGIRSAADDAVEIAGLSHVTVVVGRSDPHGVAAAAGLVDALSQAEPDTRRLLVLADVAHVPQTSIGISAQLGVDVLRLPYEPRRADSLVASSRTFRAATRTAHIELAAALVEAARPRPVAQSAEPITRSEDRPQQPPGQPTQHTPGGRPRRAALAGSGTGPGRTTS